MTTIEYDLPREKMAAKGVTSLTSIELLQVIIGSGTAAFPVVKIAKKVSKVLQKSGSSVTSTDLTSIKGVGTVKAGQIVALFELASRYPILAKANIYQTPDMLNNLYQGISHASKPTLLYITFDGAGRIIAKRQVEIDVSISSSRQVRKVFADCLSDTASSIVFAIGYSDQPLDASMTELSIVRGAYKTAQLLDISIRSFALVSKQGVQTLKESGV
jgi:DNA repair protein RadC